MKTHRSVVSAVVAMLYRLSGAGDCPACGSDFSEHPPILLMSVETGIERHWRELEESEMAS